MLDNFSPVLLILDYQDIFNSESYPWEVIIKVSNLQSRNWMKERSRCTGHEVLKLRVKKKNYSNTQ